MEDSIIIRDFNDSDLTGMREIFNWFAENSYSVYSEYPLNPDQFSKIVELSRIILVLEHDLEIIGFGFISYYKPFPNFNQTGVLTYFIKPEFTGKGYGTSLFTELLNRGKQKGITNYLAHISSENIQSLNFHKKQGFKEAGRFQSVATKFNKLIDVVWVQKIIT